MKIDKKISVIIPVYNLENYIERCLKSVQNQTYRNLEIIVIDDGSRDKSADIIRKLQEKDNRICYLYQKNSGVMKARLAGIEMATGEYIGFCDGDDEVEEDMYEILISNAEKYKADISHCGYKMLFSDGRIHYFHNTKKIVQFTKNDAIIALLNGNLIEPGLWNKLYKKELFTDILKKINDHQNIKINEDLLMNFYLFSKANISLFEDICKYNYIIRNESATRQKLNNHKIYDPIKVKKIILSECSDELKQIAQKALLITSIYTYCGLIVENNREYKSDLIKVRKEIKNNKIAKKMLNMKLRILFELITKSPFVFRFIYPLYERYFQVKRYE